jgi:ATP-dependent Lhr-like helicase
MLAGELLGAGRAGVVKAQGAGWLVATERRAQVEARDGETIRRGLLAWLEHLGPVTTDELCKRLGLTAGEVDIALAHLEAQGTVLRGSFRPQSGPEWCERRLLARIHRLTVQQLRREIIAVSPADHMRFLLRWQHLDAEARLHGREGVVQVVRQLQGMELPAPSWEAHILPARVRGYRFEDLEHLTLSGMVTWGRLTPDPEDVPEDESAAARRASTTRSTPISFLLRESVEALVPARTRVPSTLSATAQAVVGHLQTRGASFLTDIARGLRLLPVEVEDALWELVSAGLVTGDGVAGLRHLLNPHRSGSRSISSQRALPAGRWTLWRQRLDSDQDAPDHVEAFARQLLRRYGVVFRELAVRERRAPAWRLLLNVYRRLEMRQEIRGGRFVSGYVGEQYALPEAVEALRSTRRRKPDGSVIIVSAADPLNLTGILHPGERLPPLSGDSIAYRDGVIVDIGPLGEIRSRLTATGQLTVAAAG